MSLGAIATAATLYQQRMSQWRSSPRRGKGMHYLATDVASPHSGAGDTLNQLGQEIWKTCDEKGFHEPVDPKILERALKLLLIVGEVSEALEAIRKGDEDHHREELAGVTIRLLHYAAYEGIDLDHEVDRKMAINETRPYKHGKKF